MLTILSLSKKSLEFKTYMDRRILIISIFITLGAIAFLSGYLLMPQTRQNFAKHNLGGQTGLLTDRFCNKVKVNSSEDKIPNTLPLSSRKFTTFISPFSDSQKIIAVAANGEIIEIDTINLIEKTLYTAQTGIVETILSPAGDSAVYAFYDAKNKKRWIYQNLKNKNATEIEGDVRSVAFSPDGDQVAYLSNTNKGGELLIAKDGKVVKQALKTRLGAALIYWPSENFISITSYDKNGYSNLFILKKDGIFNKILSDQYNLNVKWSPSGENLIFSVSTENRSVSGKENNIGSDQVSYLNISGNGREIPLDLNTNVSKCAWLNEKEIICGIKNRAQFRDEFYKINTTDGSKTLVLTPNINLITKEIAISRHGDIIFVLNDIDDKLYALKLATSD